MEVINGRAAGVQRKETACPAGLRELENIWPEGSEEPNCASGF